MSDSDQDEFEAPTRVESAHEEEEFDAPTRVEMGGLTDATLETGRPDDEFEPPTRIEASLTSGGSLDTEADRPIPSVTALPPTEIRPLPQTEDTFEEPTRAKGFPEQARDVALSEPIAPEPIGPEPAPATRADPAPAGASPKVSRPPRASVGFRALALVFVALLGVAGVTYWALSEGPRPTGGPALEPLEDPDEEAPLVTEPVPLAEAPALRDAANLVFIGQFAEAARAYAALAREHPERPELATMAHVLQERAGR